MKTTMLLFLALGTGCAPIFTTPARQYGGEQTLQVQNRQAGVEARGWTTGQEIPTIITNSASATAEVTDANTRADTAQVAVRTEDYVERRGADLPHEMHAAQASERDRLTRGLAAQQAACTELFSSREFNGRQIYCMLLNERVFAVLNGGQGYYLPHGGSWMGSGGYYPVSPSAIRTMTAVGAAHQFENNRRRGVTPYGAQPTGAAVDSEAREAIGQLQTTVEEHVTEGGE